MEQESRRVLETKERLREAFFELYAAKKIERISIKEITDRAKLNRGTFYVYYQDIYDLLETTEDEMIEELVVKIKDIVTLVLRGEDVPPFLLPVEFFQRNSKYLRVLLGNNGDADFIHKVKTILKEMLMELFRTEEIPMAPHPDYVLEYIAAAQIGIMSYWMKKEMSFPIEELAELIKELNMNGPLGYLKFHALKSSQAHPG